MTSNSHFHERRFEINYLFIYFIIIFFLGGGRGLYMRQSLVLKQLPDRLAQNSMNFDNCNRLGASQLNRYHLGSCECAV